MSVVWKFEIPMREASLPQGFKAVVPKGTQIIHMGQQSPASVMLWGLVPDPTEECDEEERTYILVGTGHERHDLEVHVGTVIAGAFVWHVFEKESARF